MVLKRRKVITWALEEVSIFHQDPLYRALVALGLGHKIHINVMATLEVTDFSPMIFGICPLSCGLVRSQVDLDVFQEWERERAISEKNSGVFAFKIQGDRVEQQCAI